MKKFAVIVAGGAGTRMGADKPKQFLLLKGVPVICHTVKVFLEAFEDMQVVLVLPAENLAEYKTVINNSFTTGRLKIVTGGDTRFQSVKNGLAEVSDNAVVFVHDGVRCLVSRELIHRCYEQTIASGSAIPAIPSTDSIRILNDNNSEPFDRNRVMLVQTPQTFLSKLLLPAFTAEYKEQFTDEATVAEAAGITIHLIKGEETNIKITRPVDLLIAENILNDRS